MADAVVAGLREWRAFGHFVDDRLWIWDGIVAYYYSKDGTPCGRSGLVISDRSQLW